MSLEKIRRPEMGCDEGCVPRVQQTAFEAAEYRGLETVAEIGRNDSDQVCAPAPKRTREIVGAISKPFRGFQDTLPSFLGEACRLGDIIENHRDRRSRQTEVLGQLFQCDSVTRIGPRHTLGRGGFHTLPIGFELSVSCRSFSLDKRSLYELESLRK